MGPRRGGRGNAEGKRTKGSPMAASMGPRRGGRGNVRDEHHDRLRYCRFNGATARRPWKSGNRFQLDPIIRLLQWGHGAEAVEITASRSPAAGTRSSFNGATARRPWKWPPEPVPASVVAEASMGPRRGG